MSRQCADQCRQREIRSGLEGAGVPSKLLFFIGKADRAILLAVQIEQDLVRIPMVWASPAGRHSSFFLKGVWVNRSYPDSPQRCPACTLPPYSSQNAVDLLLYPILSMPTVWLAIVDVFIEVNRGRHRLEGWTTILAWPSTFTILMHCLPDRISRPSVQLAVIFEDFKGSTPSRLIILPATYSWRARDIWGHTFELNISSEGIHLRFWIAEAPSGHKEDEAARVRMISRG